MILFASATPLARSTSAWLSNFADSSLALASSTLTLRLD